MNKFAYKFYMDFSELIKNIVVSTNCRTYLELGIEKGTTFNKIVPLVDRAIGVDINDERKEKIGEFHLGTTNSFFDYFNNKVDIIFIDADHGYEQVVKDFNNSLKVLSKYGIIILHDTDPCEEKFLDIGFCGDSYKIIDYIKTIDSLNVVTLPVGEAGLSIVNRVNDRRVLQCL